MSTPSTQQADVLAEVGQTLGITMTFDEVGQCFMMFDEQFVSLRAMPERFVFYGMLGEFSDQNEAAFWRKLLSINASLIEAGKATMTLEDATHAVMLMLSIDSNGMTAQSLSKSLTDFVDLMGHLNGLIAAAGTDSLPENASSPLTTEQTFVTHIA